ncbi:MAG TPA: hypothetical protein VLQ93_13515, partial [Myxococcaceae bacterium]|nr:hypothetical protein [Myxococcaceae bacterium]
LDEELSSRRQQHRRKVFLECAVGAVVTRSFELHPEGFDRAHVEIRWSARMGIGPEGERPPALPTLPMRHVFTLARKHGAHTSTDNGMSTHRCPSCHAPLSDSASVSCDFCGTSLGSGEADWVLLSVQSFEEWNSQERWHFDHSAHRRNVMRGGGVNEVLGEQAPVASSSSDSGPRPGDEVIADPQERQRLLYMMAALASSDGSIAPAERKLLELCAHRWSVPWSNVQMALNAGPQLFTRLVPRGSPAAEVFLRNLVEMALVDGRIDRKERRMLEFAAGHLGMLGKLQEMLRGR